MAVYVDDFLFPADIPNGRLVHSSNWSHLFNDGPDKELHEFAQRLGLKREYFQHPGEWHRHYDLTQGKRWQAIRLGAKEVTAHEGTKILRDRDKRERLDYAAGVAFRNGELEKAREILRQALRDDPDRADHWTARLDRVEAAAAKPIPAGITRDTPGAEPVPDGKCPGCGTANLTYGRSQCQACGVAERIHAREREAS